MAASQQTVLTRFLYVGAGIPVVVTAASVGLQIAWMGDVPTPVATHWGPGGADGFGSPWTYPALTAGVGLLLPAVLVAIATRSIRRGARGPMVRGLAASMAWLATFIAALSAGAIAIQRGLADAADVADLDAVIGASLGLGLIVGALGWFVQPAQRTRWATRERAAAVELQPGERAVWLGTAAAGPLLTGILVGATVVMVCLAIVFLARGDAYGWLFAGLAVLFVALIATMTVFRVRVDARGVEARSPLGWPRFGVPMADVASAEVAHIDGLSEFGGWGVRAAPGAFGIILRNGEALSVVRESGRRFVVTVDDAATAAGLLEALRARAPREAGGA